MIVQEGFRFGLGHPVLEFLATLAGRFGEPHERLAEPSDLERWLEQAGLAAGVRCDERLLGEARRLREAIYRLLDDRRAGRKPGRTELRRLNSWARAPRRSPQLDRQLELRFAGPDPARAALAELAADAVTLLAGPELARVRACAAPGCSLLFIDRSRPGRRRWCAMARCGNRAKTARYRRRRAGAAGA